MQGGGIFTANNQNGIEGDLMVQSPGLESGIETVANEAQAARADNSETGN